LKRACHRSIAHKYRIDRWFRATQVVDSASEHGCHRIINTRTNRQLTNEPFRLLFERFDQTCVAGSQCLQLCNKVFRKAALTV
jgi:hypothetical protein